MCARLICDCLINAGRTPGTEGAAREPRTPPEDDAGVLTVLYVTVLCVDCLICDCLMRMTVLYVTVLCVSVLFMTVL